MAWFQGGGGGGGGHAHRLSSHSCESDNAAQNSAINS